MSEMNAKTMAYWIGLAKKIATTAHAGIYRRDKKTPYIKHCEAVADKVEDRLKPIAWLHDVVEDTSVTLQDLQDYGFPSYIVDAVAAITHLKSETNMVYWQKVLSNEDAVKVKLADIKSNLGDTPSPNQIVKYKQALQVFADAGYSA
jgi:(p)ppGpp synthase/HD superfamily hydrolase